MQTIRFPHESADNFHAAVRARAGAYFRRAGKSRFADRLFWFKFALYGTLTVVAYALVIWHPFPAWVLIPVAAVFGVSSLLLGINAAHDGAHRSITRTWWVNDLIQFVSFTLIGVNAYLWRMRHTKSHHIFPNVNGCDIDIDENPFLRLSPNQPWRPHFRWQHLYAPAAYLLVALHTILFQDFVYLFKRRLANMTDIRHPPHQYALFVLSKVLYFGLVLGLPLAVLPVPWWQVVVGYFAMSASASVAFVFLLIGTHFSDDTEFPAVDAAGNLPHAWARHNLVTACDWSPTSRWAHFLTRGVNAHAAHHLFPAVCHTHYRALAEIIVDAADELGVPYHQTTLPGMIRSHFAFLKRMGRRPVESLSDERNGAVQRMSLTSTVTPGRAATSAVSPGRKVRTSA